jgi:hypothetical protein
MATYHPPLHQSSDLLVFEREGRSQSHCLLYSLVCFWHLAPVTCGFVCDSFLGALRVSFSFFFFCGTEI